MRFKRKNRKKLLKKKEDDEYSPTEILSQTEIDKLLTAIMDGQKDDIEDFRPAHDTKKIKIYDFKRPDKFSKEQIRTISILHEFFARSLTTYFSELLKCVSHIHLASVDQLTYEEFIRSIPTPTSLALIYYDRRAESPTFGDYKSVIEIDPVITKVILNRLTGGDGNVDIFSQHELTELEYSIIETPFLRMLSYMRESWGTICDLRPMLGLLESNPQYLQTTPPTEMGTLVTLEAKIDEIEGMINIFYPYLALKPILDRLNAQWWYSPSHKKIENKKLDLNNLEIDLQFEIFNFIEKYKKLKNIKLNDILYSDNKSLNRCKIKSKNIYLFDSVLDSVSFFEKKQIIIDKKINKLEENYMETKNNVSTSLNLDNVEIQVSVELGRTKKTIKEILTWGEGSIVELDTLAGEPVNVFANNVLIAKAETVVIDDLFGIRIVEILDPKNLNSDLTE